MDNLDDIAAMKKLDPAQVLDSIGKFPDQCEQAWKESSILRFPQTYSQIQNVVVCGMGGSRFTPRTIRELFGDRIKVSYEIIDDYSLPAYVTKDTLVVLSSYSGTTEEVLSCGQDAVRRSAKLTGVMADGSGKITAFLKSTGATAYFFMPTFNPCGQPRIGGGYLLSGHMGLLKALGLMDIDDDEMRDAISFVRSVAAQYAPQITEPENPAKQLARFMKDKHIFLVAGEHLRGAINGFANQINETAKMISDFRYIPELNHHLMEGLQRPDTLHQTGLFMFITSLLYSEKIQKRFTITQEVVAKQQVQTHEIMLTGKSKLSQVLELYTLSGYATFYLSMLYDTDPVAIPWVDYFKAQLGK